MSDGSIEQASLETIADKISEVPVGFLWLTREPDGVPLLVNIAAIGAVAPIAGDRASIVYLSGSLSLSVSESLETIGRALSRYARTGVVRASDFSGAAMASSLATR